MIFKDKRGSGTGWVIFFIVLALIGVGVWAYYKDIKWSDIESLWKGKVGNSTIENETEKETCEACQEFPDIEKVAYYFENDTYKAFNVFLENSKSYLHCSFKKLENKDYASRLLALKNIGVDVKIHFGVDETMSSCDITCIPKVESVYNYLLGEGLPLSYSRTNFNFCVSERAVYLFSNDFDGVARQDFGLIIFSPNVRKVYDEYFNKISG